MSSVSETTPTDPAPSGPARDFLRFCEEEFERRNYSDDDFDEALFAEARDLVVRRLKVGNKIAG